MALDARFRDRLIAFQTEKALAFYGKDQAQVATYLESCFGQAHLQKRLQSLGTRPDRNFEELVHREDDVTRWTRFISHQRKRQVGVWKEDGLRGIEDDIASWIASLGECDKVVRTVNTALGDNEREKLRPEEEKHIALRAFRAALWYFWRR